jgi:hypothetical protein
MTANSSPPSRATTSDGLTEGVVDPLEVVEVDEHEAEGLALAGMPLQPLLQLEVQRGAVGQAGERIVRCLVLLLERQLRGPVQQQQRDQQQRQHRPGTLRDDDDQRRERQDGERHHRVVGEVVEQQVHERGVVGQDAGHQREVDREVGEPDEGGPAEVVEGEAFERMRQRRRVAEGDHDKPACRHGDAVLAGVEDGLPPLLAGAQVRGDRGDADPGDGRPQPVHEQHRAEERSGHHHALRVVPAPLDQRQQFEQQEQDRRHRERADGAR